VCARLIEPVPQKDAMYYASPSRERGAEVEHPRWPEMRHLLIPHVRGPWFPESSRSRSIVWAIARKPGISGEPLGKGIEEGADRGYYPTP
jgi:hypothetical protein